MIASSEVQRLKTREYVRSVKVAEFRGNQYNESLFQLCEVDGHIGWQKLLVLLKDRFQPILPQLISFRRAKRQHLPSGCNCDDTRTCRNGDDELVWIAPGP